MRSKNCAMPRGPSAVLDALRERIAMVPGLYLESVEQTGDQLLIKGNSPDESAVTQFGRSLEFSGGLFSQLKYRNSAERRTDSTNLEHHGSASGSTKTRNCRIFNSLRLHAFKSKRFQKTHPLRQIIRNRNRKIRLRRRTRKIIKISRKFWLVDFLR